MSLIKEVAGAFVGMFLGDLRLATAVLVLVAGSGALAELASGSRIGAGAVLLGGALLILVVSVRLAAKPRAPR